MREQRDVSPTRTMVLVLLVGGIVTIPTLFLRGLWSPDEPRYAAIAWQLARSDNPLVPRINDALYAEKPPLFFYLGMAGDVFWPSRGTRMVQAAAALGLALLLAAMGAPAGARARILAPLVFLTAVLGMEAGKFGTIDALLILLLAAAVHMGRIALGRERPLGWWLGTWVLLALANLVKGPVVLPFALLALLGSLADVRCTAPWHRHMLAQAPGLAVFGAIVLAWLLPALSHTCDEYRTQLLGQIWGRVTGERTSHLHPWHYYLKFSWLMFFPWTLLLIAATAHALRRPRRHLWLLLWLLGGFLLLSAFASKRERYLLLVLPAAALLIAPYLEEPPRRSLDRLLMRLTAAIAAAAGIAIALAGPAVVLAPSAAVRFGRTLSPAALEVLAGFTPMGLWVLAPILGLGAAWGAVTAWRAVGAAHWGRAAGGICAFAVAASIAFDLVLTPALDPVKTGKAFGTQVLAAANRGVRIALFANDYDGRFNLLLGVDRLERLHAEDDIAAWLGRPEPVALILGVRGGSWTPDSRFENGQVLASGPMGGRTMVLVGNRPAAAPHTPP